MKPASVLAATVLLIALPSAHARDRGAELCNSWTSMVGTTTE